MNITQILNMVVSEYGNITQKYMTGILLAGMIFALLNCFMGYRLRKVWGTLLGLAIGAVAEVRQHGIILEENRVIF